MSDVVERLNSALEGRYHIERELGEGGMATVYLADDLKHERKVAVKVLRPELAAVVGAERFLAEIKTTANLQHPHILPLFDSGEADSFLFYVMPYVEGESLREKLDRENQLGVDEALSLAKKIAGALDYAHGNGVVHRDIKPANILLSRQGEPLVADFGIALAVAQAGGGRITETGLSLGTPHYMSPEQATGDRDVDPRSDVYALACVLYEMLAGEPPFSASTAQAILAKILTMDAPSITMVRRTVQPNVGAALAKALEKLPADRFTSVADFSAALDDEGFRYRARTRVERVQAEGPEPAPVAAKARGLPLPAQVGVAAVLVALAAFGWLRPAAEAPVEGVTRFVVTPPESWPIGTPLQFADIAISADGNVIAYAGPNADVTGPQLYLRALVELEPVLLRGAEGGASPFFSPDGEWVGFVRNGTRLQRVSVLGGSPVTLADAAGVLRGASWGTDGMIVFGVNGGGLYRVAGGGGEPEALTTLDAEQGDGDHEWPSVIEGHDAVVFVITPQGASALTAGQLAVLDLESGTITRLGIGGVYPRYVSTGHLLYASEDGSIRAVPFDAESRTVTGSTVPLIEGVAVKAPGSADYDVSAAGRFVYSQGGAGGGVERSLVWVDRDGREEPIPAPPRTYLYARLAPDDGRVALDVRGDANDIWMWDFGTETLTPMTLEGGNSFQYPTWTPDGARLAYQTGANFYWKSSNNTGASEVLAEAPGSQGAAAPTLDFITPDGSALVFRDQQHPDTDDDLAMIMLDGEQEVVWRLNGAYLERNAALSPDGRWMAYQSDESGVFEVSVRPFPDVESDVVRVSNSGGRDPLFSRDGRELYYVQPGAPGQLIAVTVEEGSAGRFRFGERRALMEWPYYIGGEGRNYDIARDGRFLAVRAGGSTGGGGASRSITVVLNWFDELRERMGTN